jgi:hypothetical protein
MSGDETRFADQIMSEWASGKALDAVRRNPGDIEGAVAELKSLAHGSEELRLAIFVAGARWLVQVAADVLAQGGRP